MSALELKPCPFCGTEGNHYVLGPTCRRSDPYDPNSRAFPIVRCAGCFTDVPGKDWDISNASAIEAWNRRAVTADQERILALTKALKLLLDNIEHAFPSLSHLGPVANARALIVAPEAALSSGGTVATTEEASHV